MECPNCFNVMSRHKNGYVRRADTMEWLWFYYCKPCKAIILEENQEIGDDGVYIDGMNEYQL